MKTAEKTSLEFCEKWQKNYPKYEYATQMMVELRDAIRKTQREFYNQAIDDAANKTYPFSNNQLDIVHNHGVKRSILKLKK